MLVFSLTMPPMALGTNRADIPEADTTFYCAVCDIGTCVKSMLRPADGPEPVRRSHKVLHQPQTVEGSQMLALDESKA